MDFRQVCRRWLAKSTESKKTSPHLYSGMHSCKEGNLLGVNDVQYTRVCSTQIVKFPSCKCLANEDLICQFPCCLPHVQRA